MEKPSEFLELLRSDGVIRTDNATLSPLTGGVSSEIYLVRDGDQTFVVKRALSKLRVKDDWFADTGRNRFEQLYLSYVGDFLPQAVPRVRTARPDHGYFAMEYLGPEFSNWKQLLMKGDARPGHANAAGGMLGRIHARSAGDAEAARLFNTTPNFHQLRVDPYLLTIGDRHPDLRNIIRAEASRLESTHLCLVHGDFSPKNILIHGGRLVLLDCEVAWYGDPAFDAAFLLNHLFLKALYHAPNDAGMGHMIDSFWTAYTRSYEDGAPADLASCVARLLLMLMLARVDGKSPAEYLTEDHRRFIREFVRPRLIEGHFDLPLIEQAWLAEIPLLRGDS